MDRRHTVNVGRADTKCPMAQGKVIVSFWNRISRQGREQHRRCDNRCLNDILRPTSETLRTLISGPSASVSKLTFYETVSLLCSGPT